MDKHEQGPITKRPIVAKNRGTQAQEIASAIANLRKVAEAIRQRAENEGQAPDKKGEDEG